jgi:Lar family restriction alleviation protein
MTELKPCPFCGEEDKLEYDSDGGFIMCKGCGVFGPDPGNGIPLFDSDVTDEAEAEAKANAEKLWNKRATIVEEPTIKCDVVTGCTNDAVYDGWYRRRDGRGLPSGHIIRVYICEEHKTHPWLCANEPRPNKRTDGAG